MKNVLFVCVHNGARSQIAETLFNIHATKDFIAESAGIEPGKLNNIVVDVLQNEKGIDISENICNDVFEFFKEGRNYTYVITVCDQASSELCPVFPSAKSMIHWSFPDPLKFTGKQEEVYAKTKVLCAEIEKQVLEFIRTHK